MVINVEVFSRQSCFQAGGFLNFIGVREGEKEAF